MCITEARTRFFEPPIAQLLANKSALLSLHQQRPSTLRRHGPTQSTHAPTSHVALIKTALPRVITTKTQTQTNPARRERGSVPMPHERPEEQPALRNAVSSEHQHELSHPGDAKALDPKASSVSKLLRS